MAGVDLGNLLMLLSSSLDITGYFPQGSVESDAQGVVSASTWNSTFAVFDVTSDADVSCPLGCSPR